MITTQKELLQSIGRALVIQQQFFPDFRVVKGAKSLTAHQKRAYLQTVEIKVCVFCDSINDLTIDHKLARSLGGTNDHNNLQLLCQPCNVKKSAVETNLLNLLRSKKGKYLINKLVNALLEEIEMLQEAGFPKERKIDTRKAWVQTALKLIAERKELGTRSNSGS